MHPRVPTFLFFLFTFLYFCTLTWLTFAVPFVFTSPDENANFTFARMVMMTGDFGIPDVINIPLQGIVHPRSVVVVQMFAQPGSFIGWPLIAGWLGNVTGATGMLLLTPFFVLAALGMWWDIARRLSGEPRFAAIATVLLAVHPALWYYANRGMMHNVPFLCTLIAAAWFATKRKVKSEKEKVAAVMARFGVAGLLVGTALVIRTSEAVWVLPLAVFFLWKTRETEKTFHFSLFTFLFSLAIPLVAMGAWNAHLYGSPFVSGYTIEDVRSAPSGDLSTSAGQVALAETDTSSFVDDVGAMLLPFGVHPRAMAKNIWHYGLMLFPWMTVLATAGIVGTLSEKRKEKREKSTDAWRVLTWVTLGLAVWLGLVYGSWSFNDNPDPTAVTIGDSHVRYWLPLFALSTLFAARAVASLEWKVKSKKWKVAPWAPSVAVVSAVAILSAMLVFGGPDGLLRTRSVLFESAAKRTALLAATEDDAIVVVDRADKFLFPYRRVIQPLRSEATYAALPEAVQRAPLYYYGIPFPETDMTYLNSVKLAGLGLRIDPVVMIGDEMLYRITLVAE